MASKPNAERVFQVLTRILERRYDVKIKYILEAPGRSGPLFSDTSCEYATEKEGENYECYNY